MNERPHWHIDEMGYVRTPSGRLASLYEAGPGRLLIDYRQKPDIKFVDEWFEDSTLPHGFSIIAQGDLLYG